MRVLPPEAEQARCRAEIAEAEGLLRAGHPDVDGLLRALVDWKDELAVIQAEKPAAVGAGRARGRGGDATS